MEAMGQVVSLMGVFLVMGAISSARVKELETDGPIALVHRFGEIVSGLGCKLAKL